MSEEQMNDSTFNRLFIIMIIVMTIMTIIIAILASLASNEVNTKLDERSDVENTQAIAERIAPVGKFSAETVAAAPVVARVMTGEEVYASCAACHDSGVANAPIAGDASAWAERISKGAETLYANAINGVINNGNVMPARGGNMALTDQNVKDAVDFMINKSK